MKNIKNKFGAFTLIEILVAMTIFSIIMVSVFMIFETANSTALKIDLTRAMQENSKNIVEAIAKDLREQTLSGVSDTALNDCSFGTNIKSGNKLCFENNSYFLAKKDDIAGFIRAEKADCDELRESCYIVKTFGTDTAPLTNSLVSIRDLNFSVVSGEDKQQRVIINYIIQPSARAGVKSSLIKENKIVVQTTLSDRFIKTK